VATSQEYLREIALHVDSIYAGALRDAADKLDLAVDLISSGIPLVLSNGHYHPETYEWEKKAQEFLET